MKAVVFDAFGTLCELRYKQRPFTKLARLCSDHRRMLEAVMTRPLGLSDAAREFASAAIDLESLEADLKLELEGMRLFSDAMEALGTLRDAGIKVGIASNLAKPYAKQLLDILPVPVEYAWSFEVGYLKPDPRIFSAICTKIHVSPSEAVMVGDTFSTDYLGATAFGMRAIHLDRAGVSSISVPTIKNLDDLVGQLPLSSNIG
ncbi:HAD family hydrolase [Paraburkholderia sp. GAS42]|uniref:HAD family hydrolase n=1 Tax=Paraburkholderia sp. GAS42 TaxID=3035135 RepID=UPI003D1C85B6